jgi:hypothetical protein
MDYKPDVFDEDVFELLQKLTGDVNRDPQAEADGLARFLSQAREISQAVSPEEEVRHTHRTIKKTLERILRPMKLHIKLSALAAVFVLAAITVTVATRVTAVSAKQILDRAIEAQKAPATGILHTRIQVFENHAAVVRASEGDTTINEVYLDLSTGYFRQVTTDPSGKVSNASAYDGAFQYSTDLKADGSPITVLRQPLTDDQRTKIDQKQVASYYDPAGTTKDLFDQFRNNPRVRVDDQKTWTDGRKVYVLIDDNYRSQAGSDTPTFTGSIRMVFDADTYQLIESQTTVRNDDQDVIIDEIQWLANEVLPTETMVAWDLSDLQGITIVDAPASEEQDAVTFGVLTQEELAAHTSNFYLLQPVPAGYEQEIGAVNDQPLDQPYTFEIHYTGPNDETFNLQAVGQMDAGFVESSFYDGSYKSASGLTLYYSPAGENGVSGMLVAPDGECFLLWSSLTRDQVQSLVDTLRKGQ